MKNRFYPIGTKVVFVGEGVTSYIYPPRGTIGVIKGYLSDKSAGATGAFIKYPEGTLPRCLGDEAYNSFSFLELAEESADIEGKIFCTDCGKELTEDEVYHLSSGRIVCEECLDSYDYCAHCEEYIDSDAETFEVDGETICENCLENSNEFFQCTCCDRWHRKYNYGAHYHVIYNGDLICEDCYDEEYETCENCGEVYPRRRMYEDCGRYYCPDCWRETTPIHDYGYKPDPKPKSTTTDIFDCEETDELLFGVELEIDKGTDPEACAEDITEVCEDIYCKHDGSLDEGVEIVTHPCTLAYHLKELGWDTISRIARDYEFQSHEARTCGLHVHVGRWQMGKDFKERKETAGKLVMLFDRHWDNIVKFSRRQSNQLRWAEKPNFRYKNDATETIEAALRTRSDGRYQAVNLRNEKTVEFRIFNGSLKVRTIYATLEFVSNMVKYAMSHSVGEVMASQWDEIIEIESYPELNAYLEERHITSERLEPEKFIKIYNPQTGDIVKPINWSTCDHRLSSVIDRQAVVVVNESGDIGLVFCIEGQPLVWMHDLGGRLRENIGYYARRENIELVRRPEGEEREEIMRRINNLMVNRPDHDSEPVIMATTNTTDSWLF